MGRPQRRQPNPQRLADRPTSSAALCEGQRESFSKQAFVDAAAGAVAAEAAAAVKRREMWFVGRRQIYCPKGLSLPLIAVFTEGRLCCYRMYSNSSNAAAAAVSLFAAAGDRRALCGQRICCLLIVWVLPVSLFLALWCLLTGSHKRRAFPAPCHSAFLQHPTTRPHSRGPQEGAPSFRAESVFCWGSVARALCRTPLASLDKRALGARRHNCLFQRASGIGVGSFPLVLLVLLHLPFLYPERRRACSASVWLWGC